MTQVQLSVEEHINGLLTSDQKIQQLLALDLFSSDLDINSPPNNSCIPCDGIDFIGKINEKVQSFHRLFIFRSSKL